jgi:hypothetical protein
VGTFVAILQSGDDKDGENIVSNCEGWISCPLWVPERVVMDELIPSLFFRRGVCVLLDSLFSDSGGISVL